MRKGDISMTKVDWKSKKHFIPFSLVWRKKTKKIIIFLTKHRNKQNSTNFWHFIQFGWVQMSSFPYFQVLMGTKLKKNWIKQTSCMKLQSISYSFHKDLFSNQSGPKNRHFQLYEASNSLIVFPLRLIFKLKWPKNRHFHPKWCIFTTTKKTTSWICVFCVCWILKMKNIL